ncbi:MAG: alpha/beta fold hydrolase [Phycisphaerae bacterium]|nr:alpha/beta fold hydrolase [Phycisphaerae bacterium]
MQTFLEIPVAGQKLAACLHKPEPESKRVAAPVVICCHGLTGSRMGACFRLVGLGRRLAMEGIACLRFDFRGCGESDGRFQDLCVPTLLQDLLAVAGAVGTLPGCDPTRVGIVGSSFGAFTASHAAGRIAGLRCLVFWAPVADIRSLIDREMTDDGRAFLHEHGWVEHHGLRLGSAFFKQIPEAGAPTQLAKAGRPLLIYHGIGDKQVSIDHGRAYEGALRQAGIDVRLEQIDAEDHAMRSVAANDRILDGTVAWFRQFI